MSQPTESWSIKVTWSNEGRRVGYIPSSTKDERPSDMVIKCGVDEHHVHKEIISPRSEFIAAAMEGEFEEGNTGIRVLDEDDPATVERMLEFLYTGKYEDTSESTPDDHDINERSVDVVSRPRYQSASTAARDSRYKNTSPLANSTTNRIMPHVKAYALGEMLNIPNLKAKPEDKDIDIIHAVFSSTPSTDVGLRDIMIRLCTVHQAELMNNPDFVDAMSEYGDLGVGMFRTFRERKEGQIAGMRAEKRVADGKLASANKELADLRGHTRRERGYLDEELKELQERLRGMTSSAYSRADRTDGSTGEAKKLWRAVKDVRRIRGEYGGEDWGGW